MQIQFIVTVTVDRKDSDLQTEEEFEKDDGKAIAPYIREKVYDALNEAWQYNAEVKKVSFKFIKR